MRAKAKEHEKETAYLEGPNNALEGKPQASPGVRPSSASPD